MRKIISPLFQWTVFLLIALSACAQAAPETPGPEQPTGTPNDTVPGKQIGTIQSVKPQVERGPREQDLQPIEVLEPLFAGDLLRVARGGEALLDFTGLLTMRLFNDSELEIEQVTESADIPFQILIAIKEKGLTGVLHAKDGRVRYQTPTGVEIGVLGTTFFIVYDSTRRLTTVGNFGGTLGVSSDGVTVLVQSGYFLDIQENQPPGQQLPINVSVDQFEQWARDTESSIAAVNLLRRAPSLPPTFTPTPTPLPTLAPAASAPVTITQTMTATVVTSIPETATPSTTVTPIYPTPQPATLVPPPAPPYVQVVRTAGCLNGPGGVYTLTAQFSPGVYLPVSGRMADSSWWKVTNPAAQGGCWVWSNNVRFTGIHERVPIVQDWPPKPIANPPGGTIACTDEITISWSPVNDPAGIRRYEWKLVDARSGQTSSGEAASGTSTAVPVSCGDQAGNRAYTWQVRAVNGAGLASQYSDGVTFEVQQAVVQPPPPPDPVFPIGDVACTQQVTLSWSQVSDPTGIGNYKWEIIDARTGTTASGQTPGTETSAIVSVQCGDKAGSRPYTWRVRAVNGAGLAGESSSPLAFFVLTPPPPPPQIDSVIYYPNPVCAGSREVSIRARVTSDTAIEEVWLSWGTDADIKMYLVDAISGGGYYQAEAGPALPAGAIPVQITAYDVLRQVTILDSRVDISDCSTATQLPIEVQAPTDPVFKTTATVPGNSAVPATTPPSTASPVTGPQP